MLSPCQTQMREALALLHSAYEAEEDMREILLDFIQQCFRVATDHEDVADMLGTLQGLMTERFDASTPALSFAEAMQAFVDSLCR